MATLAELSRHDDTQSNLGDSVSYRQYVIACAEVGKTPLSMQEWQKAGKPTG